MEFKETEEAKAPSLPYKRATLLAILQQGG